MSQDWPWSFCLGCAKHSPEQCDRHSGGGDNESPYRTLTRWGSLELVVRLAEADEFRARIRSEARKDRLRVRTYAHPLRSGDLALVLAELSDYTLTEGEQLERLSRAMAELDLGVIDPDPDE